MGKSVQSINYKLVGVIFTGITIMGSAFSWASTLQKTDTILDGRINAVQLEVSSLDKKVDANYMSLDEKIKQTQEATNDKLDIIMAYSAEMRDLLKSKE